MKFSNNYIVHQCELRPSQTEKWSKLQDNVQKISFGDKNFVRVTSLNEGCIYDFRLTLSRMQQSGGNDDHKIYVELKTVKIPCKDFFLSFCCNQKSII